MSGEKKKHGAIIIIARKSTGVYLLLVNLLGDSMDICEFYTGKEFSAYEFLGAHVSDSGVVFRTYAPNALHIALMGEFSRWQEIPMEKIKDGNFWECRVSNALPGMFYKYRIYKKDGGFIDHADPYAFYAELRPKTASVIYQSEYSFEDGEWMKNRKRWMQGAINIYELHFGSWRKPSEEKEDWYTYEELAEPLIHYLKENGYNFVEIMPLSEYPCDESWGYQATGYYSPTARYGTPDGLRYFIDQCHLNKIGVILDFVPVHFAVNDYALWNYDGTAVYEYPYPDVSYNEWGSCNFNHARGEVCSFLQSSAYFWLKEFHFDGLRMDAVGNLIYWQGDQSRGENKASIQFMQNMNQGLKMRMPEVILCAEDSTSYSGVTRPVDKGGLGFDYKWDLGWMNDTLSYLSVHADWRKEMYHRLTFSMYYYYNEHYLMPLSHDEVVHGKKTIVDKMSGNYEEKFAQARVLYLYMMTHPGKKLNFMGNELGQLREWDETKEPDWFILKYPIHDAFYRFIRDLNHFYLENSALWEKDYELDGFRWIDCHQEQKSIYVYERCSETQTILVIFNLSGNRQSYRYAPVKKQTLTLMLDSNWECYSGTSKKEQKEESAGYEGKASMEIFLPAFSGRCYFVKEDDRTYWKKKT